MSEDILEGLRLEREVAHFLRWMPALAVGVLLVVAVPIAAILLARPPFSLGAHPPDADCCEPPCAIEEDNGGMGLAAAPDASTENP